MDLSSVSISLAERIPHGTRSRKAVSRQGDRLSRSTLPTTPPSRSGEGNPALGSDSSKVNLFSFSNPTIAGQEVITGIHTLTAPHIEKSFNASDDARRRPPSWVTSSGGFLGRPTVMTSELVSFGPAHRAILCSQSDATPPPRAPRSRAAP